MQKELDMDFNNPNYYTIKEIELVLNKILDLTDVAEWIFEFKKFKNEGYKEIVDIEEDKFVIPQYWKIQLTDYNKDIVGKWFNNNRMNNSSVNFSDYSGEWLQYPLRRSGESHRLKLCSELLFNNLPIITSEQFMKHIYNKTISKG